MTSHIADQIDLLSALNLPDRYERLQKRLGPELANILVPPSEHELDALGYLAQEIRTRDEGVLVPICGDSGMGKTTFAANLSQWKPDQFTPTLNYDGEIKYDDLTAVVSEFVKKLPADESRIIPVNLDHRESNPASDPELAAMKRFLRTSPSGLPTLLVWPETSKEIAQKLSKRYTDIAGAVSINLPLVISGPDRSAWVDITLNTLRMANDIESLDELGVDPRDYKPEEYSSIGHFLRQISQDFNQLLQDLRKSLLMPIRLAIVFVSETPDPGILSQITNSTYYGLLDAQSLIAVTPESGQGRWWSDRRGLLTRTIVQMNAHAFSLAPATSISAIRNCGPVSDNVLDAVGVTRYGPARGARDLGRSDLGKFLRGEKIDRFENRGTPAGDATAAFQLVADRGFNLGKDKKLNQIMTDTIREFLDREEINYEQVACEEKISFCKLIPDNAVYKTSHVICVEYTWRKGDFLTSGNRSTVAQYILQKLQAYARQLGWTSD